MKTLNIANGLSLPIDVVTQKVGWLGVTGSGKTYGASKLAELLWHAGAQFIVLDPVGVWYGLRLAKDGRGPSDIKIPIFGGLPEHRDVALEPTGGALLADLIVDRSMSAIIDVSQFESDAQKARFGTDFAERFFFRKKAAPSAVHLFIEECQEFVPQNTMKGEERMLHAFVRLQKLGRNFGIGSSYISQRPQEVNKKALNMAQTLFVFRTTGPQERKAIEGWIQDKGLDQDIAGDLPKLKTGDAHAWSPEWLGVSKVVRINEKNTFNASATPTVGATAQRRELAPIDLEKIRKDMAATIERAKEDDPRELRKERGELRAQIKELEKQLAGVKPQTETKIVEKPVLKDSQIETFRKIVDRMTELAATGKAAVDDLIAAFNRIEGKPTATAILSHAPDRAPLIGSVVSSKAPERAAVRRPAASTSESNGHLPKGERSILIVLAQYPHGKGRRALGTLAGYSSNGGSFGTYISRLRAKGYVDGSDPMRITAAGLEALGDYEALPRGEELVAYWLTRLGKGERAILEALINLYPQTITREQLGELAGYEASGGSFGTYISRLRTRELIHPNELRASEAFFE